MPYMSLEALPWWSLWCTVPKSMWALPHKCVTSSNQYGVIHSQQQQEGKGQNFGLQWPQSIKIIAETSKPSFRNQRVLVWERSNSSFSLWNLWPFPHASASPSSMSCMLSFQVFAQHVCSKWSVLRIPGKHAASELQISIFKENFNIDQSSKGCGISLSFKC